MAKKTHLFFGISMGMLCLLAAMIWILAPICRFTAEVLFLLAGVLLGFYLLLFIRQKYPKTGKILLRIYSVIVSAGVLIGVGTGACVLIAGAGSPETHCDYIIVLGAAVRGDVPSVSLSDRIRAAYDYLKENPDTVCIASGGQGAGEQMSEAACIYRELTAMGIEGDRIWLEEKSTSTLENITFSQRVLEEHGVSDPGTVGILSSEYHLFRAGFFARKFSLPYVGIPAKTSMFPLRVNYTLREIVAVWHHILIGGNR